MLPEFLELQTQSKMGPELSKDVESLALLKDWLNSKENETRRQVRPAWMEICWALITLLEQRLQEQASTESMLIETHIVARQVARQRGKRQLATRFVTDEIKRLSQHQQDFIQQQKNTSSKLPVIGWYRMSGRRGLGFGFMTQKAAIELLNDSHEQEEVSGPLPGIPSNGLNNDFVRWFSYSFVGTLTAAFAFYLLVLPNLPKGREVSVDTLALIKEEGIMRCGVDGLLPHFSLRNDAEQIWWGLDVELCNALGAALDVKVDFIKVSASRFDKRIAALENQDVHILFRNTSHTVLRDLNSKIIFGPIYFYEREFFLDFSPPSNGLDNSLPQPHQAQNNKMKNVDEGMALEDIKNKSVCVKPGTSNELALQKIQQTVEFSIITQDSRQQDLIDNVKLLRALREDQSLCDLVFGNYFILKQLKSDQERRYPEKSLTLRSFELAGFDPLAPVLLRDYSWQNVINYSFYALLYADKLGITSYNVHEKYQSGSPIEQSFLKSEGMQGVGLSKDWAYRIIAKVGNYSEIYFRSIVCDYASCQKPDETEFHQLMLALDKSRWPNKVFRGNDTKPGILQTPKF